MVPQHHRVKGKRMDTYGNTHTEAQADFLKILFAEREGDQVVRWEAQYEALRVKGVLTKHNVSQLIEHLKEQPRKAVKATVGNAVPATSVPYQPPTPRKLPVGYYTYAGNVYTVVHNRSKTSVYAKRFVSLSHGHGKWAYTTEFWNHADKAKPLTLDEAATLGHLHGVCVCCARTLTDPVSVKAGIGPTCAKRLRESGITAANLYPHLAGR